MIPQGLFAIIFLAGKCGIDGGETGNSQSTALRLCSGSAVQSRHCTPAPTGESADANDPADTNLSIPEALPAVKCTQCGVVSSLREIADVATQTGLISSPGSVRKSYEVTVQMRDGSRHVFREIGSSVWHVGERMIIIGGV